MKFRSLFFTALCGMAVSAAMVSCSDDSGYDPYELGSQVALPEHRGFVLNEGTYKNNDASISFFDAVNDTASSKECDLYFVQNKKQLGDTGQDIITYNGNIYVVVYGSNYIAKLCELFKRESLASDCYRNPKLRYTFLYIFFRKINCGKIVKSVCKCFSSLVKGGWQLSHLDSSMNISPLFIFFRKILSISLSS